MKRGDMWIYGSLYKYEDRPRLLEGIWRYREVWIGTFWVLESGTGWMQAHLRKDLCEGKHMRWTG